MIDLKYFWLAVDAPVLRVLSPSQNFPSKLIQTEIVFFSGNSWGQRTTAYLQSRSILSQKSRIRVAGGNPEYIS